MLGFCETLKIFVMNVGLVEQPLFVSSLHNLADKLPSPPLWSHSILLGESICHHLQVHLAYAALIKITSTESIMCLCQQPVDGRTRDRAILHQLLSLAPKEFLQHFTKEKIRCRFSYPSNQFCKWLLPHCLSPGILILSDVFGGSIFLSAT